MGLKCLGYPAKHRRFSCDRLGKIGDITFYGGISYEEFLQGKATIVTNIHLARDDLQKYRDRFYGEVDMMRFIINYYQVVLTEWGSQGADFVTKQYSKK